MPNLDLIEKIQSLPPDSISEVEDFVDFLADKQSKRNGGDAEKDKSGSVNLRDLGISAAEAAEQRAALSSFAEDWERPEMEVYDKL